MNRWATTALVASQLLLSNAVFAHGPTPQKIDESVVIEAPIEAVWEKVSDFNAIADWHPSVESSVPTDEQGTRVLAFKDKGTITESLDELDADRHYLGYRLLEEDIDVFPVSFYSVSVELTESDAGTEMLWQGRFYRADTGNFPPEHYSDEAAVEAMTGFAQDGMNALKAELEGQK